MLGDCRPWNCNGAVGGRKWDHGWPERPTSVVKILPGFRRRCRTRRGEAAKRVLGRPSPFWDGGSRPVDFDSELGSVRATKKAFWWCLPLESLLRQKEMKRVRVDHGRLGKSYHLGMRNLAARARGSTETKCCTAWCLAYQQIFQRTTNSTAFATNRARRATELIGICFRSTSYCTLYCAEAHKASSLCYSNKGHNHVPHLRVCRSNTS